MTKFTEPFLGIEDATVNKMQKFLPWEFPNSAVVKVLRFSFRGCGFYP